VGDWKKLFSRRKMSWQGVDFLIERKIKREGLGVVKKGILINPESK